MRKKIIKIIKNGNLTNSRRLCSERGLSLIELLIAALLTGILTSAAFQFYASMHIHSETQFDKSEIQHICRVCLTEMKKTLRMAGYKLDDTIAPYVISGDSLMVYYNGAQPIDTITYALTEFTVSEYAQGAGRPSGVNLYMLTKKTNANATEAFADYITRLTFTQVDSANIDITIEAQAQRFDETYTLNEGFHTYTMTERVNVRNLGL